MVERSLRRLVELGALPTAAYHLACALGFLAGASPQPLGALAEAWARGHPASGPAWTFRAELARRAGAFAEAAAHAQRALAVAPQDPVAKDILQRALAALAGR